MEHSPQSKQAASHSDLESTERRDALRQLGRYASYVPPVVLTLLVSQRPCAASPIGGGGTPPEP
jgi:hypothetical protein